MILNLSRSPVRRFVLGVRIDVTSYSEATCVILDWATAAESRYVCVANVNNVMEAYDSCAFRDVNNRADLVTPDGVPLVWALRVLGARGATRVYGPDLTLFVLKYARERQIAVGFYGGSAQTLQRLSEAVATDFPGILITYAWSPPFRLLTEAEGIEVVNTINESGARILFVGLSSPTQDRWMAANRGRINAVMIGVGAAFDFLSGTKRQAPRWVMKIGMEWFFRFLTEPRRLWKRYLKHNPRFVVLFALQLLGWKDFPA